MPGVLHQGILSLFRDDPWLAHDLLGLPRPVDGTPVDRATSLDVPNKTRPWQLNSLFPDLVLAYRDPEDRRRGAVLCIDAQLENDPEKRYRVGLYQALLAYYFKLPVSVILVSFSWAFSRAVRSWVDASPRIDALLLDRATVAPVSLEQARARPAAAVLVAALHGFGGDIDMAKVALEAIRDLPMQQREDYTLTILAALPERQRTQLIRELPMNEYNPLWEIERRSGTYLLGLRTGREEGREEGLKAGLRALIFAVLELRGLEMDSASAARIQEEASLETLEHWAAAARAVGHVSRLFD